MPTEYENWKAKVERGGPVFIPDKEPEKEAVKEAGEEILERISYPDTLVVGEIGSGWEL